MEDSGERQDHENAAICKENNKKQVKTPFQVEALKDVYKVNKYPTEEIKAQLSQQLGLTERQITNWFCNRRVRDKRLNDAACGDGRQDHPSGVILQERGSARQDSTGSTKQGSRRPHVDLRDVESRSLHGQESPSADLTYELRTHYPGNIGAADDTSSESSSALQERCYSQNTDKYDVLSRPMTSRGIGIHAGSDPLRDVGVNYKPSGYLKVRGEIENAAVTAVKRQLGRHYHEYGPPLGVEFQLLPPGAFESVQRQSAFDSYYDEDPAMPCPPNSHQAHHRPSLKARRKFYDSKASSQKSYKDDLNANPVDRSEDYDYQPRFHSKQKCAFPGGSDHLAGTGSSFNMQEYSMGDGSVNGERRNRLFTSKHAAETVRSDHLQPNGVTEPRHREFDVDAKVVQSCKKSREKPLNPVVRANDPTGSEGGGPSRKIPKVKHRGGGEASNEHFNPVSAGAHPPKPKPAEKQLKNEVPKLDYYAIKTPPDLPLWSSRAKGYTAETGLPSSDDETAATCSSSE